MRVSVSVSSMRLLIIQLFMQRFVSLIHIVSEYSGDKICLDRVLINVKALRTLANFESPIHLCKFMIPPYTHDNVSFDNKQEIELKELGVYLWKLSAPLSEIDDRYTDSSWRSLYCGTFVSERLFRNEPTSILVFIANTYLLAKITAIQQIENFIQHHINAMVCTRLGVIESQLPSVCSLRLLAGSMLLWMQLHTILNASTSLPISAHNLLAVGLGQIAHDIHILPESGPMPLPQEFRGTVNSPSEGFVNIVRSDQHWFADSSMGDIIEFDGLQHRLAINNVTCTISVHVEWATRNTIPVIFESMKKVFASETLQAYFSGCMNSADYFGERLTKLQQSWSRPPHALDSNAVTEKYNPRIFDCILFNDEISLLQLRLKTMSGHVDAHIIVESSLTFTGKAKPLYFADNVELFRDYMHKIVHVVMDLPHPKPTNQNQVWANEYSSRDAAAVGLQSVHAEDADIIIIADTDEIVYPPALHALKMRLSFDSYPTPRYGRYFKLMLDNYMYNFDCYVDSNTTKLRSPITVTTIGYAKSIANSYRSYDPPDIHAPMYHPDNFLALSRMYLENEKPLPLPLLLYPAGWHLSFFGGLEKIQRKLESYSHVNFVEQFVDAQGSSSAPAIAIEDDANSYENEMESARQKVQAFDPSTHLTDHPMSPELIRKRVSQGRHIDPRISHKCSARYNYPHSAEATDFTVQTAKLRALWDSLASQEDRADYDLLRQG